MREYFNFILLLLRSKVERNSSDVPGGVKDIWILAAKERDAQKGLTEGA